MERAYDLIMFILLLTCQQTSLTRSEKVARSVSAWYNQYHDLNALNRKLIEINSTFDNAFLFSIGKTSEGRDMMALKITGAKIENKPLFYTQCLIHAREWVTGSLCLYMADELTKNYGVDPKITALLDKMDFVILPVANPDGYAYSWYNGGKNDYTRLWVKNRRRLSRRCHGVNLNRNFGYAFGHKIDEESRKDPCSKTYIGRYAFSEPETRNIRDYLTSLGGNLRGFIDFRAKGRSWHYPWKYTSEGSADTQEQKRVAIEAVRAIYYNGGYYSSYMSHSAGLGIQAGGTCMDWVYGHLGVKYSFTVKLQNRYGGSDGYKLRPAFIPATVKEAFIGVKALVDAMNV